MPDITNCYSLDDYLDILIVAYHGAGKSYSEMSELFYFKSQVLKCVARGEENGLNEALREVIKDILEEK